MSYEHPVIISPLGAEHSELGFNKQGLSFFFLKQGISETRTKGCSRTSQLLLEDLSLPNIQGPASDAQVSFSTATPFAVCIPPLQKLTSQKPHIS